uniref:GIY-YIG endonuclease n=1 Tax=Cryphonectria parasitica TaxID=5116 RepID=A0A191MXC7_CRYPA|nr:GIY-YIG endonuclease [Cryphonectria parasitica]
MSFTASLQFCRFYVAESSSLRIKNNSKDITPVVIYPNADLDKSRILADNLNTICVYRWVNKINGDIYVGSSTNIPQIKKVYFSTSSKYNLSDPKNNRKDSICVTSTSPVVIYSNAELDKTLILKNNQKKVGIYRWVNKVNGNSYVGSSVTLANRLRKYYTPSYITHYLTTGKSRIYVAILKYGHSNFQLEILEYCTKEEVIEREQYFIDLLKPEYNINPIADSWFGNTHSEESRIKMSNSAKGRKLTEETKKLLSLAKKGINNPNFGKITSEETKALISLGRIGKSFLSESIKEKMSADNGTAIRVIDLNTNETSVYTSITKAAKAIGITQSTLSIRFKNTEGGSFIVKKRYQIEKVNS